MNKPQEGTFERAGKTIDKTLDRGKQKVKDVKDAVGSGIDSANAYVSKKATEAKNAINRNWNDLCNTYRDVSDKVKSGYNSMKVNVSNAIDNGQEWATNKLKELDGAMRGIDRAIAQGTLKAIERSAKTGTMIVIVGKEKITYTINSVKAEIQKTQTFIKEKSIQAVNFSKEKGMLVLNTAAGAVKVSIFAALSAGLVLYKGGELVVDKSKLVLNYVGNKAQEAGRNVVEATKTGVAQGRRNAADFLRNTASRIDDPRLLAAEK